MRIGATGVGAAVVVLGVVERTTGAGSEDVVEEAGGDSGTVTSGCFGAAGVGCDADAPAEGLLKLLKLVAPGVVVSR